MIGSTTTFLDLSVVVDDVRIACRHHEQQSPLDRPRFRNTRCMGHSPGRTLGPVLHPQQPPADDHVS